MDKVKLKKISKCLSTARGRKQPWPVHVDPYYVYKIGEAQNWKCAITGISLEFANNGKWWRGQKCNKEVMTIDRIDSSKGYVEGNIQLLCCEANAWKADFTHLRLIQYNYWYFKYTMKNISLNDIIQYMYIKCTNDIFTALLRKVA